MEGDRKGPLLTAFVLTALIAFPAASQNISYGGVSEVDESSPVVDDSSSLETDVSIDSDLSSEASIEEAGSLYTVEESHNTRVEKLSTPSADLLLEIDNSSRIYTLETAYGTLVRGIENGLRVSDFEGANRSRVVSTFQSMRSEMESYRMRVRDEMTPDLDLTVTQSKASDDDERVVIDNEDSKTVDLSGWTIENSDPDEYVFDDLSLDPGQQAFIYTAGESELNVSEDEDDKYIYGTGVDWDGTGDKAKLFNQEGSELATDSY